MSRLLLHAPNIHFGGGFVLLKELLAAKNIGKIWCNLDIRISGLLTYPSEMEYHYVYPSILSRLAAEFRLQKIAQIDDLVLCFHSLPPILPIRGHVVVFLQNRYYLSPDLSIFSGRFRQRLMLERFIFNFFKKNVHEYIVQTPSMQSAFIRWHKGNSKVKVIPFMQQVDIQPTFLKSILKKFDFIYVAHGEPHKNHSNLLEAWILLAKEEIYPSLVVTLSDKYSFLLYQFQQAITMYGVKITNLNNQPHEKILQFYHSARALIFPSISESFGLPLIEASNIGWPIIASELDFVRDICIPVQTFNPYSPVSIARDVKRFLNIKIDFIRNRSATEFISELRCER